MDMVFFTESIVLLLEGFRKRFIARIVYEYKDKTMLKKLFKMGIKKSSR